MVQTTFLLAAAVALAAPVGLAAGQSADSTLSTRDGVYSARQARRGEQVFQETCAACHLPEYFTSTMMPSWAGAPVSMLFSVISTTMPEDRPGSLASAQYADVLAYIFELNGLPAGGRELPAAPARLARIIIERSP